MSDVKAKAKTVVKLGRIRNRLIQQRSEWVHRQAVRPEARHIIAELDRDLLINADLLRSAKEALAQAKKLRDGEPTATDTKVTADEPAESEKKPIAGRAAARAPMLKETERPTSAKTIQGQEPATKRNITRARKPRANPKKTKSTGTAATAREAQGTEPPVDG